MASVGRLVGLVVVLVLMLVMFGAGWTVAKMGIGSAVDPASMTDLERRFTEQMKDAALVGQFTIAGREDRTGRPDRYDIASGLWHNLASLPVGLGYVQLAQDASPSLQH